MEHLSTNELKQFMELELKEYVVTSKSLTFWGHYS